ncbi:hypothetical protein [Pinirhizobacter soli]|uniref:hypothetical protein n=1 Tax=Pinirhizobacter soli TaxID=2786953 RepID=UPI00202AA328|nr:hypothetical protein [Pinirhizobacter soli]
MYRAELVTAGVIAMFLAPSVLATSRPDLASMCQLVEHPAAFIERRVELEVDFSLPPHGHVLIGDPMCAKGAGLLFRFDPLARTTRGVKDLFRYAATHGMSGRAVMRGTLRRDDDPQLDPVFYVDTVLYISDDK